MIGKHKPAGTTPRLLARFLLRKSANGACIARMSIASGDYVTEARVVGEDIEIKMFKKMEEIPV